jgi:hypothetical protein
LGGAALTCRAALVSWVLPLGLLVGCLIGTRTSRLGAPLSPRRSHRAAARQLAIKEHRGDGGRPRPA